MYRRRLTMDDVGRSRLLLKLTWGLVFLATPGTVVEGADIFLRGDESGGHLVARIDESVRSVDAHVYHPSHRPAEGRKKKSSPPTRSHSHTWLSRPARPPRYSPRGPLCSPNGSYCEKSCMSLHVVIGAGG